MAISRFILVDFPVDPRVLEEDNTHFFDTMASTFNKLLAYEVSTDKRINIKLRHYSLSSSSLAEININPAYKKNYQMVLEYNNKTGEILALHDYFFTQTSDRNLYRLPLDHLYLHTGKYSGEALSEKRLNDSMTYGVLIEIALHNPGDSHLYTRGLMLADYLNKYPPKETYKIITKRIPWSVEEDRVLDPLKNNKDIVRKIKNHIAPIPQINFDEFDKDTMVHIMREYGSFEVVGPQIEKLKQLALKVFTTTEEIFNLPEVRLKETEDPKDFNGYKNILQQTQEIVSKENKGTVLHQQGYFYKPYKPRVPMGVNAEILKEYYYSSLAILQALYRQVALCLKIPAENVSSYLNDEQSVLSLKHYPPMKEGDVGIQKHSDYSTLTLVGSKQKGLEIKHGEEWIAAPHEPWLRFYANVGDWLLFQLNNASFTPGIHRVPAISEDRYSITLFCLPPLDEERRTPNGKLTPYRDFLYSDKSAYINPENKSEADPTLTPVIKKI